MKKLTVLGKLAACAALTVALFGSATLPGSAQAIEVEAQPVEVQPIDTVAEPTPVAPLPWGSIHLVGEMWANGQPIGSIDFALLWNEDDPGEAQLWALLGDVPQQVCVGRIFDTPGGEPIFFGSTSLMSPAGTCYMSRLPDHSGVSLFAASNDGQWAAGILKWAGSVDPAPIFE